MNKKENKWLMPILAIALIVVATSMVINNVLAVPSGASISFVGNTTKPATTPDNRTDPKGSISTMNLNTVQQNDRWKAYVGNVSGTLTLDDADSYTIYDWAVAGTVAGSVFASRNSTINWYTINCSNTTYTRNEEDYLSMSYVSSDSIENTFSSSNHSTFTIANRNILGCNYTSLYVNDTSQQKISAAHFQEILLADSAGSFVYASKINDNSGGYRNGTTNDFQMIVGERAVAGPLITYFFFVELQ